MRYTLAWARTPDPPKPRKAGQFTSLNGKVALWLEAQVGKKETRLFEQGTQNAWNWAKPAQFIRWFTDGERRYGKALWKLASVYLKQGEAHPHYHRRQVWREGLEVAIEFQRFSSAKTD